MIPRSFLPNALTSFNLFLGCCAIISFTHEKPEWGAFCIYIAGVVDFLDGFVARAIKGQSELGKQLDSLADVVTFGVAPGIFLFQMLTAALASYFIPLSARSSAVLAISSAGFLIPVFAAIRLARFNITETKGSWFQGMPTPAAGMFIASFAFVLVYQLDVNIYHPPSPEAAGEMAASGFFYEEEVICLQNFFFNPVALVITILLISFFMVSSIRFFSLKLKSFGWRQNQPLYIFLVASVIAVSILLARRLDYFAIPALFVLYIFTSFVTHFICYRDEVQS